MKFIPRHLDRFCVALAIIAATAPRAEAQLYFLDRKPQAVTFVNGSVSLAGSLVEPEGAGPFPAVVVLHGSGPALRDEPAFIMHANAFLRKGFAVLIYDKRGSGKSNGNLDSSDYSDLASDALAGVRFLRARPEIAKNKIGFIGRSEGGWVGPLAASRDPSIAFVIMSSGSAVAPHDEVVYWTKSALIAHGAPDSLVRNGLALKAATWEYYRDVVKDYDAARTPVGLARRDSLRTELKKYDKYRPEIPSGLMNPKTDSLGDFRAWVSNMFYDPLPALQTMHAPLLELLGAKDEVVEPSSTLAVLDKLRASGHDVTIRVFPGVGHSLAVMEGDTDLGYPPGYLDFLSGWARSKVRSKK